MKNILSIVTVAMAGLAFAPNSIADTPVNLNTPDSHSVPAKGKLTLYRVQVPGLQGIGEGTNKVDADLMVTLDTDPKTVYTLKLDKTSPVNQVLADTLRDAYLSGSKVTLYRQITGSPQNNVKIMMVEMEK